MWKNATIAESVVGCMLAVTFLNCSEQSKSADVAPVQRSDVQASEDRVPVSASTPKNDLAGATIDPSSDSPGEQESRSHSGPGASIESPAEPSGRSDSMQVRISYGYEGEFGRYGMADTAEARLSDGTLLAKARLVRLVDNSTGPVDFDVEEEQYSGDGQIVYKGKIVFKYNLGDWVVGERNAIEGNPRFGVFSTWPGGN